MAPAVEQPRSDGRLRWARIATLTSLAGAVVTSVAMPGIGLLYERDALWIASGAIAIVAFAATQAAALYGAITPVWSEPTRRRLLIGFVACSVLSVPLLGPVGAPEWESWAWLGGSIIGSAPVLFGRLVAASTMVAAIVVAAAVALWTGGSVVAYVLLAISCGIAVAGMSGLPVWLWGLLVQARAGRSAQARLAASEERLRFARDVHDLLGHNLSVIALKAELAARLAPSDADGAAREAAEVQRLAASALTEMRAAVHGYRAVDLGEQLVAVAELLGSSGVRCTVTRPDDDLPPEAAALLGPVLREATTNVLRHSRASWCRIEISRPENEMRMTVANDAAGDSVPDSHSHGLRGLAERLADAGGVLRTRNEDGVFTLEATVPVRP